MRTTATLPDLGLAPEGQVVLSVWYALPGDIVLEGERLVEVLTEGATFDVAAPSTGRLIEQTARPHDVVRPGQVLGVLQVVEADSG